MMQRTQEGIVVIKIKQKSKMMTTAMSSLVESMESSELRRIIKSDQVALLYVADVTTRITE